MDTLQETEDLFRSTLQTHPFMVDFNLLGRAGNDVSVIPGAAEWLEENVPYDDWEFGTHFGNLHVFFADKAKAALFKTFFQ